MNPKIKWAAIILLMAAMALPVSGIVDSAGNGTYCIVRSTVADLGQESFTWTPNTFAGLYYDVDNNIGAEQITFNVTNVDAGKTTATLSDQEGARGIIYRTTGQNKNFKFKAWGSYKVIGFLGEPYFAAYNYDATQFMKDVGLTVPIIYAKSKNRNLMTNEQLSKILIDSATETTIASDAPLELAEGYELILVSINVNETKVKLELRKNGQVVATAIIQPGVFGADFSDKTYVYTKDLGSTKEVAIIGIYFGTLFHEANKDSATINGIFQISDTPIPIKVDQQYGRMSIRNVDPSHFAITMDNKDNLVTLSKNKVTDLMPNIFIKTADQDLGWDGVPLRYYIYGAYNCSAEDLQTQA